MNNDLKTTVQMINALTMQREKVTIPQDALQRALKVDASTAHRFPTKEECEAMMTGDDESEDLETSPDVRLLFPLTTEELESAWQLRGRR